ncbi:hypothetical protein [Burkholderia cepacia]|uniref:hypothetical protein n=1 Tax=Burkholderia cepacia TaxID=292 RepID=UPI001CF17F39|nr:hypothetical protein [Burkholderia cepacia]MCA8355702.1 hypothetical protein [Burkholderia cepacia]
MQNDFRQPHAPLTAAELRQIYDENPTPAVRILLWEIHRLRLTVIHVNDVRRCFRSQPTSVPTPLWDLFLKRLDAEPCLREGCGRRR